MGDLAHRLRLSAGSGDLSGVLECLASGANPNGPPGACASAAPPLLAAATQGQPRCIEALLAAGADPDAGQPTALHLAACSGEVEGAARLLEAGANPAALADCTGRQPLHCAASKGHIEMARLLLREAPAAALQRDKLNCTPLDLAVLFRRADMARLLLSEAPLQPAREILAALAQAGPWALPLYPILVARQPLTAAEWARVPCPCPGLGTALPAVLQRSIEEAELLVRHLLAMKHERLHMAGLCLKRAAGQLSAPLPSPLVWRILALSVA